MEVSLYLFVDVGDVFETLLLGNHAVSIGYFRDQFGFVPLVFFVVK